MHIHVDYVNINNYAWKLKVRKYVCTYISTCVGKHCAFYVFVMTFLNGQCGSNYVMQNMMSLLSVYVHTYIHTYIHTCVHVCMYVCYCMYVCICYNTPRSAVADLQLRCARARSARGWSNCKSATARLGV